MVRVPEREMLEITAACEHFIATVLVPRFLPRVEPTDYNYPVALKGAWHSGRYRFLTEYKCGGTNRTAEGFETPYVRLDYIARNRFRLHWMRHTGKWTPAPFGPLPLDEALGYIASEPYLQPHC